MQIKASVKFLKTSPRKVRLVVGVVRRLPVTEALERLRLMNKGAASPVAKLINSAVANAEHNFELNKDNLYISEIMVDEGQTIKRWMPRAHGRATPIRKRTSHINLVLAEIKDSGEKQGKKLKIEAPVSLSNLNSEKANLNSEKGKEKLKPVPSTRNEKNTDKSDEAVKEIVDPRVKSRGGHARAEGGRKGFSSKIFRRKSG